MIYQYLWVLLWIWDLLSNPPARLMNELQAAAQQSFADKNYEKAAKEYSEVVSSSIFADPAGRLNMANAYFLSGDIETAGKNYATLSRVNDRRISATAKAQLGMIALMEKDTAEALIKLKEAILLDRTNASVIANFEILSHRFSGVTEGKSEGEKKTKEVAESESPAPVTTPEEWEEAIVERSDQREQLLQKLDRMNMSEEEVKSILDAMKVNERQYIYQLRRQEAQTGAKRSAKVEW